MTTGSRLGAQLWNSPDGLPYGMQPNRRSAHQPSSVSTSPTTARGVGRHSAAVGAYGRPGHRSEIVQPPIGGCRTSGAERAGGDFGVQDLLGIVLSALQLEMMTSFDSTRPA